jgi:hypothetical protein
MTTGQLMELLCDEPSLRRLHEQAWTTWPIDELVARATY